MLVSMLLLATAATAMETRCHGAPPCEEPRVAWVDFATFGVVPWLEGGVEVTYDYAEAVRRIRLADWLTLVLAG